jgi:enterochelin esterase-like enzyme
VTITAAPTSPPEACIDQEGRVISLHYPALDDGRLTSIRVYQPPCLSPEQQYPTLYALHGLRFNNQQWIDLGIRQLMDAKIAAGEWPPFFIAMPFLRDPLFTGTDGGRGSYEQEFLEAVIPYMEGRFETNTQRAIVGISRGAVWALEIAFQNSESFRSVVALSPSLHLNMARPKYDPLRMPLRELDSSLAIYLGVGDGDPDGIKSLEALARRLAELVAEPQMEIKPGGHDNPLWILFMGEALQFVADAW